MTRSSTVGLLVESLLVLLGVTAIVGGDNKPAFAAMILWTLMALIYVIAILCTAWRHRLVPDSSTAQHPVPKTKIWVVFLSGLTPVVAAFMGLVGSLTEIAVPSGISSRLPEILGTDRAETLSIVQTVFTVVTVLMCVLGWFLLHLSYARHYERLDHVYGPAFTFPGAKEPELTDYVYFAMTIGTTFATSDVTVTSRWLRWSVTVHSILAFFYNAIVMAVAFKLITN